MICPKCGMHDRVSRTVTVKGKVTRIRRCVKCGHSYETVETIAEPEKTAKAKPKKKGVSPAKTNDTPKGALASAIASVN